MDPDAVLTELRELAELLAGIADRFDPLGEYDTEREMAEKFQALDTWLTSGGHPPNDWR